MQKFIMRLRWKIRKWLGLGEIFIGVDMAVSRRDQSCVVVISRLNGGSVRIIDCQFENVHEMNRLVRELQQRYGVSSKETFVDMPPGMRREF